MIARHECDVVVGVNLLPERIRCQTLGIQRVYALATGFVAIVLILAHARFMLSLGVSLIGDSSAREELLLKEVAEMQRDVERAVATVTALRDTNRAIADEHIRKKSVSILLSTLAASTPPAITTRRVVVTPSLLEVSGVARNAEEVQRWLRQLVLACGGYTPTLEQLRVVELGRIQVHEFVARVTRPQSVGQAEPCRMMEPL
jgi:Tfp pilus assembly protein PilN